MPLLSHICRRGGTYYFRLRIPLDLVARFRRREIKFSLKTKDPSLARPRSMVAAQYCIELFEFVRRNPMLDLDRINELSKGHFRALMERDRQERRALGGFKAFGTLPVARRASDLEECSNQLACLDFGPVTTRVEALLNEIGLAIPPKSPEFERLCELVLRAERAAIKSQQERDRGNFYGEPHDPLFQTPSASLPLAAATPTANPSRVTYSTVAEAEAADLTELALMLLSDFVEHVITERGLDAATPPGNDDGLDGDEARRSPSQKSVAPKYRAAARALIAVAGDRPIYTYRKIDLIKLKRVLVKTPANYTQRGFNSVVDAANANKASEKKRPTLAVSTINNGYLTYLKSLFEFATDNGGIGTNIATGVHVEAKLNEQIPAVDLRGPFEVRELNKIFSAPLFAGSSSNHSWHHPGSYCDRGHRFWIPQGMLFGGLRTQEFGQSHVADVVWVDDYPCLKVTTIIDKEDLVGASPELIKTLKSGAAHRTIPIHWVLIAFGFLDYVAEMKKRKESRLFPELKKASDGTYSANISKEFNGEKRFLDRLDLKSETKVLYSLRHNYKDALRGGDFEDSQQDYLMGHAGGKVADDYGSRDLFGVLIDKYLRSLHYPGLDLSHVRETGGAAAFRIDRIPPKILKRLDRLGVDLTAYCPTAGDPKSDR